MNPCYHIYTTNTNAQISKEITMVGTIISVVTMLTVELIPLCAKLFGTFITGGGFDMSVLTEFFERLVNLF